MTKRRPRACTATTAACASTRSCIAGRPSSRAWCSAWIAEGRAAAGRFASAPSGRPRYWTYLDSRELVTDVYRRKRLPVTVGGRRVVAWGYVVRREHPQYAGQLAPDRLLDLVRRGVGRSGDCRDYLLSTVSHLEAMGIVDGPLHMLAQALVDAGALPAHA